MSVVDVPTGYSVRPASIRDAHAIADLVNEVNVAEIGIPWTSVEEVRDDLTLPGREPDNDLLLVADDGALVGYLTQWPDADPFTEVFQLAFVRPATWGSGLSTSLLRLGEQRARRTVARTPHETPVFLRVARWVTNDAARALFESLAYRYARTFHEMQLELDGFVKAPEIPDGIAIRRFDRDRDARAVHAVLAEAFADHWGHGVEPFEQWVHAQIDGESSDFDAGLWFVATDGEHIVGAACCRARTPRAPDVARVEILGVRRGWRKRGVGRALLLSAFEEMRRRGILAVDLGVDSDSPTGATRLYEGVGMRPVRRHEVWEKELQPS